MSSKFVSLYQIHSSRLSWPAFCLVMLLQRSPMVRMLNLSGHSLIPRVQHLWKAVVAAVTVGAYNSVTAASTIALRADANKTTAKVGKQMRLFVQYGGGDVIYVWEVTGQLPPGVTGNAPMITEKNNLFIINGWPTAAGSYPISVQAWGSKDKKSHPTNVLNLTLVVESDGPVFTQHPSSQAVEWGGAAELSVIVEESASNTYQWQKQNLDDPQLFEDLPGETNPVLSLNQVTTPDSGYYCVEVTKDDITKRSDVAELMVNTTPFEAWKESRFTDPFSAETESSLDPDQDSLINAVEFTFGLNPLVPEKQPLVSTSLERIEGISYVSFSYPPIPEGVDSQIFMESNPTPGSAGWTTLTQGIDGTIVESTSEEFVVKVPANETGFNRLKIVSN